MDKNGHAGSREDSGKSREPFEQLFIVMRHSERLDFADLPAWLQDPDSELYPLDAPITDYGRQLAVEEGLAIAQLCSERKAAIDLIVSSPFLRCIQTAVACRSALHRSGVAELPPMLLDAELGEVNAYHKPTDKGLSSAMLEQHEEICRRRRTFEEVRRLPDLQGVKLLNDSNFAGTAPPWCEPRRQAHLRALDRFAEWVERGRIMRMNILVVTHQDLVHVFSAMMNPDIDIEDVAYCGWCAVTINRSTRSGLCGCLPKALMWRKPSESSNTIPPPLHRLQCKPRLGVHVRSRAPKLNDNKRVRPVGNSVGATADSLAQRSPTAKIEIEEFSARKRERTESRGRLMSTLRPVLPGFATGSPEPPGGSETALLEAHAVDEDAGEPLGSLSPPRSPSLAPRSPPRSPPKSGSSSPRRGSDSSPRRSLDTQSAYAELRIGTEDVDQHSDAADKASWACERGARIGSAMITRALTKRLSLREATGEEVLEPETFALPRVFFREWSCPPGRRFGGEISI